MAAPEPPPPLPSLPSLYERHIGLTFAVCSAFAEAAHVAIARHHAPPTLNVETNNQTEATQRLLEWAAPNERTTAAHGNDDDATRDGAYAMAIAAVEVELHHFAVSRAQKLSGADYLVSSNSSRESELHELLEDALRLEVSGTDEGDRQHIEYRLSQKIDQVSGDGSDLPALAVVVGFKESLILIAWVEDSG